MTTPATAGKGGAPAPPTSSANTLLSWIFKLGGLAIIDAITLYVVQGMLRDGVWQLALVIAAATLMLNFVFLREDTYPLRWMAASLFLLIIIVIYPILSTLYVSLTNYGDGHLLTKPVALRLLQQERFLAENAKLYNYTAFVNENSEYLLWLESEDGAEKLVARPGVAPEARNDALPETLDTFRQLTRADLFRNAPNGERHSVNLQKLTFGSGESSFQLSSRPGKAAQYQPKYVYDANIDQLLDQEIGATYKAIDGAFQGQDGKNLIPGWSVNVGLRNFNKMFNDSALSGPFISVFIWTVIFAALSALTTFALGLFLAITFDSPDMPFKRVLRSLLLVPYTIPAFISVPLWKGLLTPQAGVISVFLAETFGWSPQWFSDPTWAKIGILMINLWLGFPYMFLITTGALQALPTDIYEAADLDGATPWQQFRGLTLPLLLVSVGPLLVGSFAFNFNNFGIIELYNRGGPPMPNTASPVGFTDILATYTARIAFFGGRGADLGYAAAITVLIFLILLVITFFQFRFTNMLEESSKNI